MDNGLLKLTIERQLNSHLVALLMPIGVCVRSSGGVVGSIDFHHEFTTKNPLSGCTHCWL